MSPGRIAAALGLASVALAVVATILHPRPSGSSAADLGALAVYVAILVAYAGVGGLVASRRPENPIGWLMCALALLIGVSALADAVADEASGTAMRYAAWFGNWVWVPQVLVPATFVLLLFPDGRLPSRRWRAAVWISAVGIALVAAGVMLDPGPFTDHPDVTNPIGVDASISLALVAPGALLAITGMAAAVAALIVRFRRAGGAERQQIKWLAFEGAFALAALVVGAGVVGAVVSETAGNVIVLLGVLGLPLAIGIAVLRHNLYDIDLIVRRTLVYAVLSGALGAVYVALVIVLQGAFSAFAGGSDLAIAGSTLVVAALFRPARRRVQDFVDRRFYRRKYDSQRTVDAFSSRLRDEVDLEALSAELRQVVAETVQPRHVSLWLREAGGG